MSLSGIARKRLPPPLPSGATVRQFGDDGRFRLTPETVHRLGDFVTWLEQVWEDWSCEPRATLSGKGWNPEFKRLFWTGMQTRLVDVAPLAAQAASWAPLTWKFTGTGDERGWAHIAGLMRSMRDGRPVPPLVVGRDKKLPGGFALLDGRHRVLAAKKLGVAQLWAIDLSIYGCKT